MNMQMEPSYVGAVVISGLVIVFTALVLLIIAVTILGKVFTAIKNSKAPSNEKSVPAAPSAPAAPVSRSMPMPAAEEDDQEIIAVIAAAVAAMSEECGKQLRIKSIKQTGASSRSSAWARAAQSENTRVF